MHFFFQELYSHIDKNSGETFEDMFLVKIASKGTSLTAFQKLRRWYVGGVNMTQFSCYLYTQG